MKVVTVSSLIITAGEKQLFWKTNSKSIVKLKPTVLVLFLDLFLIVADFFVQSETGI